MSRSQKDFVAMVELGEGKTISKKFREIRNFMNSEISFQVIMSTNFSWMVNGWLILMLQLWKTMLDSRQVTIALCSRNFENVKLRLDFVEIWSFYRLCDFTWNQILVNSNSPKKSFLTILEVLEFDFSKFEQLSGPKFTKIHSWESLNVPKMTLLDRLNSSKLKFTNNLSGGKLIHFNKVKP